MKTITHKGKVYEIGKPYKTECGYGELTGFSKDDNYFVIHNNGHRSEHFNIFEISKEDLGTIKDAPIVPENGNWYRVEQDDIGCHTIALFMRNDQWHDSEEGTIEIPVTKILSKLIVETK